jgi:hypothetical protein
MLRIWQAPHANAQNQACQRVCLKVKKIKQINTTKRTPACNKRFERKQGETAPIELLCYIWNAVFASTVVLKSLPASSRRTVGGNAT